MFNTVGIRTYGLKFAQTLPIVQMSAMGALPWQPKTDYASSQLQAVINLPCYVPILKSKAAEHWAIEQSVPEVRAHMRPVVEVVPEDSPLADLKKFIRRVIPKWPTETVLTFDTGHLDQTQPIEATDRAILWTARKLLEQGVAAKSVMRLSDDPSILEEVAEATELHGHGACLRLGSQEKDPSADEAASLWPRVLAVSGLAPIEVDLLIDFRTVEKPQDVERVTTVATQVLEWASQCGPWRSVTLASGAFPESISSLPSGSATPLRRYDAELFCRVVEEGSSIVPDFGDYGIWHPGTTANMRYRPNPNLKYTYQRDWQIYREQRTLPGHESFFTLCERVVDSEHWPDAGAAYSAGDKEIARCAQHKGGPGGATQWLQWGASHHFAHVVDRLTTLGEP